MNNADKLEQLQKNVKDADAAADRAADAYAAARAAADAAADAAAEAAYAAYYEWREARRELSDYLEEQDV